MRVWAAVLMILPLAACSTPGEPTQADLQATWEARNVPPKDYKGDILAYMRTYLNDPTGVKEAAISEPVLKPMGLGQRYVSCVRYRAKTGGGDLGSARDHLAVFVEGKLDAFKEGKDQCSAATYAPFPELETLAR